MNDDHGPATKIPGIDHSRQREQQRLNLGGKNRTAITSEQKDDKCDYSLMSKEKSDREHHRRRLEPDYCQPSGPQQGLEILSSIQ